MSDASAKTKTQTNTQNSEQNTSNQQNSKSQHKAPKRITWHQGALKWLRKVAAIIRDIIHLAGEFLQHLMDLLTYTFSVAVKLGISPVAPIVCVIILFLIVSAITINQWWAIGAWAARFVKIPVPMGVTAGLLFGIGINIFQLTPKLRKLNRAINRAYARLNINPEYEAGEEDNPAVLESNWLSENHRKSKIWSAISYCVETALVIIYVFLAKKLALLALIQAFISLILPEKTLDLASNTISLMGTVSREVAFEEPPESSVNL
jgi:hypothetical protein